LLSYSHSNQDAHLLHHKFTWGAIPFKILVIYPDSLISEKVLHHSGTTFAMPQLISLYGPVSVFFLIWCVNITYSLKKLSFNLYLSQNGIPDFDLRGKSKFESLQNQDI
jgi:hypothetical protein